MKIKRENIKEYLGPNKGFCWRKIPITPINHEGFNKLIDDCKIDKQLIRAKTLNFAIYKKFIKSVNTWRLINSKDKEIWILRVVGDYYEALRYRVCSKGYVQQEKEQLSGSECYQAVNQAVRDYLGYKTVDLRAVLSGKKYKEEYIDIKQCVPVQIQYMDRVFAGKFLKGCYKADVSSAFPTQMMKDLPTLKGCKRVKGRVKPTEEYPFAFYIKSHHIKTLDGCDSKILKSYFYNYYRCDDSIKAEDDETILCKKMDEKYHTALKHAFNELYNHRKDNQDNKQIMNATIGYFQLDKNPMLSFISAIVILRCNIDMIKRCKQLVKEGNRVVFIATDSIVWLGNESSVATDDKYLGSFTYEGKGITFYGFTAKCYQWLDNDKCITKCSGRAKTESSRLSFGELTPPTNDNKWMYDDITGKYFRIDMLN